MSPRLNDGSRPSRLRIGQHLSGELRLSMTEAALPEVVRLRAEIEACPVAEFNAATLRARAAALADVAPRAELREAPKAEVIPLFRRVAPWLGGGLAIAAAALFMVQPPPKPSHRSKGEGELGFYLLRDGQAYPGDVADPVRAGDRVQFTYRTNASGLILLGVDGAGTVQTYYPDEGQTPVSVVPGERHVLEGSILLDDAPGPEVFVAFYGEWTVAEALAEVKAAYSADGSAGLVSLDRASADVSSLVLEKE